MKKSYSRKDLDCKICEETVKNVSSEATAVTCWKCVNDQLKGMPISISEDDIDHKENEE
jgi:hypothetical protein